MSTALSFDADLLRRYDRPGPRYTSYPTAPQFRPDFDETQFRAQIARSNDDAVPRRLSLYLHIPYCTSPCFYCGCNRIITRDRSRGEIYLARLLREVALVAPLFDRDRDVIQLHLGGGTPNFLAPGQLAELFESLDRQFHFSRAADRDFSIELDPRFVSPADIGELAATGWNRASLGVQDFDPAVQTAVNRVQSVEQTMAVIDACRQHGMRSVNVDLIYGLPRQTLEGFGRTLDTVIAARPDRLAVYGYAHLPDLFKAQKQIHDADLPSPDGKLALLALAIEKLTAAGYDYIGMDHFALPEDELARAQRSGTLHRNFMGYTTHAETDLLGLGVSAISRVGDSFSQHHRDLSEWEEAVDAGRLPIWRGLRLSAEDLLRNDIIQRLMCHGTLDIRDIEDKFDIDFATHFADALARLAPLQADGLVEVDAGHITATARGRLLMRIIAMCFDAYLGQPTAAPARYSKAI
ncbi:oxygen-independent coproporphyrinogen III oxidase [Pseudofulvimonas gallinarii]|uniref:Coproporphyrinogen-III oxidase n=1 Tax=Pseudofulvimonas gallinarii TaxID=634155 RepID=A0A4S3KTH1_9GAMM|nr:oxygen-independent coproporphyrinogen III oxidase [Pseudofulvimonas gallinarii]TCS92881.1 anaerobic coproporphyrinogen III oxidase [Pseudofulvimonas gallinarii]THD12442.1 oxygen-independent coproporphyrinogen III oxidase [Pseudofulvimonas gallinarii]